MTFTLLSALAVTIALGCIAYTLVNTREALMVQKRFEIKHSVEGAATIVRGFVESARKGEISEADAQKAAVKALEKARFDENNFFFIYTFDTLGIMHPNKQLVGVRHDDMRDTNGRLLIRDLAAAAKAGGAFVDYYWIKNGDNNPSLKISYAYGIPEWQWFVGAGLHVQDVDAVFWGIAGNQAKALAPIAVLFIGLVFLISRNVSRLLFELTFGMSRLAAGDLRTEIEGQSRSDEIGAMARAVQVFKDNAIALAQSQCDKSRLEDERAQERAAREAEKAREAEQLQFAISSLAAGLEQLSIGNLVQHLETPFPCQSEKLRIDFNISIEKLQQAMHTIHANARRILTGSSEISAASDNLARRTQQQAASLEETAAALDQINSTVKETAVGATHARDVVLAAKSDAERSREVVRKAIEAMGGIENSSRQIGQIIGVIDEIAFQTGLLALNAGVEAARAGEEGRGFAVVASEVRGLAQRSAAAAKEIKFLISTSAAQVEQGVDLVAETGMALDRIVATVEEINSVVSEIASSAQEQATGLNDVNTAVNHIDQITQQNAAMVEETTAAAQSLSGEATQLVRLVGHFQVGQQSEAERRERAA
jgi:methyl-accepting chemotaxis protein